MAFHPTVFLCLHVALCTRYRAPVVDGLRRRSSSRFQTLFRRDCRGGGIGQSVGLFFREEIPEYLCRGRQYVSGSCEMRKQTLGCYEGRPTCFRARRGGICDRCAMGLELVTFRETELVMGLMLMPI